MRDLEEAIARQVFHGGDLPTNLLEIAAVREDRLIAILAETLGREPAPAGRLEVPPARVLRLVPAELAIRHGIFPLDLRDHTLVVATAEALSAAVEGDLGFALDLTIQQVIAPLVRIRQAIAEAYGVPLDRRYVRLAAKLDGQADPNPSVLPPPDQEFIGVKMPRPVSVPSPSFGTGVPELGRLYDDKPAPKTPFVAAHDFVNPSIPKTPGLPVVPPGPAEPPVSARTVVIPALAGVLKNALREERAAALLDKNGARPAWRPAQRRKGPFTAAMAERELSEASTLDVVLDVVFAFAQQFFEYTASFAVQGNVAQGHDAGGPGARRSAIRSLSLPLDQPSALALARERGGPVVAELARDGLDAELRRGLGREGSAAVAVLPLVVRGRVVALLYGDDGSAAVELAAIGDVLAMVGLAGAALERLALRRKLGGRTMELPARPRPPEAPPRDIEAAAAALARAVIAPAPVAEAKSAFDAFSTSESEAIFGVSPPEDVVLSTYQGPRTARYFEEPVEPAAPVEPEPSPVARLHDTNPGLGAVRFPEADIHEETSAPALKPPDQEDTPEAPSEDSASKGSSPSTPLPQEPRSPTRRRPAPVYEGRSASKTLRTIGFEPLPSRPPPNATAWAPSSPPPAPQQVAAASPHRSDPPIPREEELVLPGQATLRLISGTDTGERPSVPSAMVDVSAEHQILIQRVLEGGPGEQEAFDDLVRFGEHAVPAVMTRFPGPLRVDRQRARGDLPAASRCGPILELVVAIRRPALPFVCVRLTSPDPEIRFWATHVLGELPYPEAATALLPRLFDDDGMVRRVARRAAASLVTAGEAGAPILKGLDDFARNREEPVANRVLSIDTMGEIRSSASVPALVVVLDDPSFEVVEAARRALLSITRQDFGRDAGSWREWLGRSRGRHRIEWLIDALTHEQPSLRRAAGEELKLLTKEYFGSNDDVPKRAQAAYRAWWDREGRARFRW